MVLFGNGLSRCESIGQRIAPGSPGETLVGTVSHGAAEVSAVGARQRNRLVEDLPLNQAAPFHVVEEESRMALPERKPGRRR